MTEVQQTDPTAAGFDAETDAPQARAIDAAFQRIGLTTTLRTSSGPQEYSWNANSAGTTFWSTIHSTLQRPQKTALTLSIWSVSY